MARPGGAPINYQALDSREFREQLKQNMANVLSKELDAAARALLEIEGELVSVARDIIAKIAAEEVARVVNAMVVRMERSRNERDFREEVRVSVQYKSPIYVTDKPMLVGDWGEREGAKIAAEQDREIVERLKREHHDALQREFHNRNHKNWKV